MYRIIGKRQAARNFDAPSSEPAVSDYPGLKNNQIEYSHPDRVRSEETLQRFEDSVDTEIPAEDINVSLLLEQNKDRGRLIREIKKITPAR